MKMHNFYAGPAILPKEVIKEAAKGALNFNNSGLSILEISHRSKGFSEVIENAEALIKELLHLPSNYHVLFTTGGASSQFFMVPMNLLNQEETAYYVNTGTWSTKAIAEAQHFGHLVELASSKDKGFNYIPKYKMPKKGKYLHLTSNNTIFGTQIHHFPKGDLPIVCDMSSDFLSRPIDIEKFGLIYAGAQKNLGPAGVTVVIVREDMLGTVQRQIPTLLNYETFVKKNSMFNTPPVFPIYVSMLTLNWLKAKGGVEKIERLNKSKAKLLYTELDNNPLFTPNIPNKRDRSLMNVTFQITNPDLESDFLAEAEANGIVGIKGHRSVGGFRASIYNAMPRSSVKVLTDLMADFANRKG
ncbi:MAG TPA: 3-phosphoserine/phosphohydroxythreonine transaminase [Saprospiraceae bacterium]|nr:3-phosphoserine/phosphohydroxythreonine transaminase [Saprospiraceae bacterium]